MCIVTRGCRGRLGKAVRADLKCVPVCKQGSAGARATVLLHKHDASVTRFPFLEKLARRPARAGHTLTQAPSKMCSLRCPRSRDFLLAGG